MYVNKYIIGWSWSKLPWYLCCCWYQDNRLITYFSGGKKKIWQTGCWSSSLTHHIFYFVTKCFGVFIDSLRVELSWREKIRYLRGILEFENMFYWLPKKHIHLWCPSSTWEAPNIKDVVSCIFPNVHIRHGTRMLGKVLWEKYKECQMEPFHLIPRLRDFFVVVFETSSWWGSLCKFFSLALIYHILEKCMWAMRHIAIEKILVGSLYSIIFLILDLCPSNLLTIFPEDFFPYSLELETTFR